MVTVGVHIVTTTLSAHLLQIPRDKLSPCLNILLEHRPRRVERGAKGESQTLNPKNTYNEWKSPVLFRRYLEVCVSSPEEEKADSKPCDSALSSLGSSLCLLAVSPLSPPFMSFSVWTLPDGSGSTLPHMYNRSDNVFIFIHLVLRTLGGAHRSLLPRGLTSSS